MRSGTNHEHTKNHNKRVILEVIRLHEPVSRAEIARHTALTNQTVSNIVEELLLEGVVLTRGRRQGGRGQPALELEFNPQGAFSVGVHLDRDLVTAVLVNLRGEPLATVHHRAEIRLPEQAYPFLKQAVQDLIAQQQVALERVWGVGLALPGPVDGPGSPLVSASTEQNWVRGPVRDLLERELRLPVYVENDATAAAIGEHWYAAHRSARGFFYLYFGLGLGGGMIHEGQPYKGFAGNAIEVGHVSVRPGGAQCDCGGRGCLELFASGKALLAQLERAGTQRLRDGDLERLLEVDDSTVLGWLEDASDALAVALIGVENLFDPEAIVLGGRLPRALLEALLPRLERRISPLRMRQKPYRPALVLAEVGEDAAALGAATLPIFDLLAPSGGPARASPTRQSGGGETSPQHASADTASGVQLRR